MVPEALNLPFLAHKSSARNSQGGLKEFSRWSPKVPRCFVGVSHVKESLRVSRVQMDVGVLVSMATAPGLQRSSCRRASISCRTFCWVQQVRSDATVLFFEVGLEDQVDFFSSLIDAPALRLPSPAAATLSLASSPAASTPPSSVTPHLRSEGWAASIGP